MNRRMGFGSMAVTAMAACLLVGFGKRRRGLFLVLILLILTAAGGVTGCGGSAGGGSGGGTSDPGTPRGSYVVSVTATSANITRSANFTVTVQ
jgi:apolipoprotein N-acyltransferase